MIPLLFALCTVVSAVNWDAPPQYDPVWLASVQLYPPAPVLNDTRFWLSGWVNDADVEFRLFTRRNPFEFQVLTTNDSASLHQSNFDFSKKVKVLTHGWLNHGYSPMPESIKEAYLNVSDLNIIVVDWGVAANVNYILASYNVASVGRLLTEFLNFLIGEGVSMDDVHLIGHSLGAHVVGIAGAYVKKGPIDTITETLSFHFLSPGFCAHNRAHMYFSESIISDVPFTAVRCESYDELYYSGSCKGTGETLVMGGFDIHYGKDGVYYLRTNAEKPFALGDGDPT
ncbi:phospholipase A1 member A [Spodoptera frugiperda]|uniref:Phospholipase A1 member A n=1 Tax=Spodoptera frugiperda TaxID=7108 RepID=A0A9R0EZ28_SPOFR|nr:phospholipase A1 member A [Spodoptera frugiperda]